MPTYDLTNDLVPRLEQRLKEHTGSAFLSTTDKRNAFQAALRRYSKDRPKMRSANVTGDGTFLYAINTTNFPSWSEGFSQIDHIEYPYSAAHQQPIVLDDDGWDYYTATTTKYLRFFDATPTAAEAFRAHYSIAWVLTGASQDNDLEDFPEIDLDALCDLAAYYAFMDIASKYIATGDDVIQADTVNYRSKASEAKGYAKARMDMYLAHIGGGGSDMVKGAAVTMDFDTNFSFGPDYLTHSRVHR